MQKSLRSIIFGSLGEASLENRIFNAVMIMLFFIGLAAAAGDFINHLPFSQIIICFFVIFFSLFGYAYSRKTGNHEKIADFLSGLFLVLLSAWWFPNGGTQSGMICYFFVLTGFTVTVVRKISRIPFLVVTVLGLCLLIYLEYSKIFIPFSFYNNKQRFFDIFVSVAICVPAVGTMVYIIFEEYLKERRIKNELLDRITKDNQALEKALREIKTLRGCLPICSKCKKIRDDKGYWNQIETYISEHSGTEFTHGICPECAEKLYGVEEE